MFIDKDKLRFKPKDIIIYNSNNNEFWLCYIKKILPISFKYKSCNRFFIDSKEQLLNVDIKNDIYFDSYIGCDAKIIKENYPFEEFDNFVNNYISNLIFK